MKITKLTPQGFCKGVRNAIYIINNALKNDNLKKPIYMLGNIVHNKNIVKAFENKGIIILEGTSRLDMLKDINEGTVIFTAHGVSDEVRRLANEKGLDIIDATCRDVERTHILIKEKLQEGYTVLFYGKAGHPETEGILGIDPRIVLIEDKSNLSSLANLKGKLVLTNQTTMSYLDVVWLYEKLKVYLPNLELLEEVCSATRRRQEAVLNSINFDLLIVVGDKLSNNTKMLKELGEKKLKITAIQVESIADLKDFDFSKYTKVAITAGASTPRGIVEEIIYNLENNTNFFVSTLTDEDYLEG